MIAIPDPATLQPRVQQLPDGHRLFLFPTDTTPLLRIDFLHEAGPAYQPQPLCAAAAGHLFTVASAGRDADHVSEFMDYRGIIVEHNVDILTCRTTFYLLHRYLGELLPLLRDLLRQPAFPQGDFDVWCRKKQRDMQEQAMKTSSVARRLYYQTLFGADHPLGRYAQPEDALRLGRRAVVDYYRQRYSHGADMVLSGCFDPGVDLNALCADVADETAIPKVIPALGPEDGSESVEHTVGVSMAGAVQTTLRAGRVLPLRWDDPEYARIMMLTTILGGYFGSRLMSNLREDKGYTYGVNARTQIYRGAIVFYITTDVAAGTAQAAEDQIRHELQLLCDAPVPDAELDTVRQVMAGDFLRSVDGIFERAERYCGMLATRVDERLTDHLRDALASTTPADLLATARRWLRPDQMLYCRAGSPSDLPATC